MSDKPDKASSKAPARAARDQRLAAALRTNMRRRKLAAGPDVSTSSAPAAGDGHPPAAHGKPS